jgi:hypothetical protein
LLWRDVLSAVAAGGDRAELQSCAEELYAALGQRRVDTAHAETDTLVDDLLPGFRRRVAQPAKSGYRIGVGPAGGRTPIR